MNDEAEEEPSLPPGLLSRLRACLECVHADIQAVLKHDPAAHSLLEVLLTYPGLHALCVHRISNILWERKHKLSARVLSHLGRFFTGIEIHPAARMGRGVFIDHGMGVVIGETATVGDDCILFKGVVLGGTNRTHQQRHPQLGQGVVVGTNACILGNIEIGDGARVGSGSVVLRSVPQNATVVGVPGRIVDRKSDRTRRVHADLDHAALPDPISSTLRSLKDAYAQIHERIRALEHHLGMDPSKDHDETAIHSTAGNQPPRSVREPMPTE
ncbi:MAG: serine O-acetyltransferase [Myxococcota bacterium]